MKPAKILFSLIALFGIGWLELASSPGDVVWSKSTGGTIFGSPAIGSCGEVVVASYNGSVSSFNPDGSLRWSAIVAGDWIDSSPTIAPDGTVYVASWDSFLYALDGNSGQIKWSFQTGGFVIASPALGPDGTIYLGSNDGFLWAINPDGSLKWVADDLPSFAPINSDPVLNHAGDTLYFGTDYGDFYALDASNGNTRWIFSVTNIHPPSDNTDFAITGSAAVSIDGNIYFGCENFHVYALNPGGQLLWHFEATGAIRSGPVISTSGEIYFAAEDGYLYFLDSGGYQLWETFVGDVLYCTPAIDSEGNIIIAGYAGSATTGSATDFTCVSPYGEILWEYSIGGVNDSSPNIAPDGSVYMGAHDGYLYKLEGYAGLMKGDWPVLQGNRRHTGYYLDLQTVELLDYFPQISVAKEGWAKVPWFGSGWISTAGLPWLQHIDHGYLYLAEPTPDSIWFFDPVLNDWLYGVNVAPNFYYRFLAGTWIYHLQGTSIYSGRWFWDYSAAEWMKVEP